MRRGRGRRKECGADVAAELTRQERRFEALRLRVGGLSTRAIGRQLGISYTQAQNDIKRAISERGQETADELRAMGNEALEAVLEGHLASARRGDDKSAQVVIKAIATHAKINGYEAPKQINVGGGLNLGPTIFIPGEQPKQAYVNGSNGAGATPGGLAAQLGAANGVPKPDDG